MGVKSLSRQTDTSKRVGGEEKLRIKTRKRVSKKGYKARKKHTHTHTRTHKKKTRTNTGRLITVRILKPSYVKHLEAIDVFTRVDVFRGGIWRTYGERKCFKK